MRDHSFLWLLAFMLAVLIICVIALCSVGSSAHAAVEQRKTYITFRKAWFQDCMSVQPAYQCVAMWSQVKPETLE